MNSEQDIQRLENKIPGLAAIAAQKAFREARKEGLSVVISAQNGIFELMPNGERKFLKKVDAPLNEAVGTTVHIP